jgi:hypothetical protein
MEPTRSLGGVASHSLLNLLAEGGGRNAALSLLHQRALQVAGGSVSLLFEQHPASGQMQATSGAGTDVLPTAAWEPAGDEAGVLAHAFTRRSAVAFDDLAKELPALHAQVATARAILLPLSTDTRRIGLLVIGLLPASQVSLPEFETSDIPAGLVVALELSRLRQREEFERDIRALLDTFAEHLASTLDLAQALQPLCVSVTRLFAGDRTTVWLHDRESRSLTPFASSHPGMNAAGTSVRADDPLAPAAHGLRSERAGIGIGVGDLTSLLTVPLRGCRRALGTVVCEGLRVAPGDDIALLNRADELGRQLSSAVETVQLLTVMKER